MSEQPLFLTIDLGSTKCKVSLFNAQGTLYCSTAAGYPTYTTQPGFAEQKPIDWQRALVECFQNIRKFETWSPDSILAISVTGQMHGILPVDSEGQPLHACLTLHDQRASVGASQITQDIGLAGIYQISGERFSPSSPLAKIAWMANCQPQLHRQTCYYLACKDYLKYFLTGEITTDPIEAAGTLLYDLRRECWSSDLMKACEINENQLPPILAPSQSGGRLQRPAAELLGLKPGLPVVVGAGDDIECLGMGAAQRGQSLEHFGTTGSIATCVGELVFDPEHSIEVYPHPESGLWLLGGSVNNAGKALSWAGRLLYGEDHIPVAPILDGLGPDSSQNPLLFLPHLTGERCPVWNPDLRGSWLGLSIQHNRDDLYRAVAQGTLFSLRSVIDRIEQLAGPVTSVSVSDSVENGASWLALRANIYQKPIQLVDCSDPTAFGAMMTAAVGLGIYKDYGQAVSALITDKGKIQPNDNLSSFYQERYRFYEKALQINTPLFEHFATSCRHDASH